MVVVSFKRFVFFGLPFLCIAFSLFSLWNTQSLTVHPSQNTLLVIPKNNALDNRTCESCNQSQHSTVVVSLITPSPLPVQKSSESKTTIFNRGDLGYAFIFPSTSPSATPLTKYITQSLHGTRERTLQKYLDTTTNTPLQIPLSELFGNLVTRFSGFSIETPSHGIVDLSDDLQNLIYTPEPWYHGYVNITSHFYVYDEIDDGVQVYDGLFMVRVRPGVVLNQHVAPPPIGYQFAENTELQCDANKRVLEEIRSMLPAQETWLNRSYENCAVVGNGGSLRGRKRGDEIDSHDVIVRFNLSPIQGYEEDVGSKTHISFASGATASSCWKRSESTEDPYEILSLFTFSNHLEKFPECVQQHTDVQYSVVNYLFVDLMDSILNEYQRVRLNGTYKKYRSTGMLAVTAMAMICDHVSVFGFERGPNMENFYYDEVSTTKIEREWSGHSYMAEKEYYKDLAKGTGLFEPFLELYDLYKSFSFIVD